MKYSLSVGGVGGFLKNIGGGGGGVGARLGGCHPPPMPRSALGFRGLKIFAVTQVPGNGVLPVSNGVHVNHVNPVNFVLCTL